MSRLLDKVAIVTGGARGMGASHARRFVEEGAKVVITDLNVESGQALADELGENAIFVQQNVAKADDWVKVVEAAEAKFGPVNVLVNNAGISIAAQFETMTEEEYRRIVDINQVSVFLGMQKVLPSMKKTGNGSIINVSSINGIVAGAAGYTDTKFAVRGMSKAAAIEYAKYGIRVNSVHPGVIETPMVTEGDAVEQIKAFAKFIPLQRIARSEEITSLVLFLASDESSYSTGAEFIADGGITAQ